MLASRCLISRPGRWQFSCLRKLSTDTSTLLRLRRSYLYVPSSSDRMLEKTRTSPSDVFIYDLEDSISPLSSDKIDARERLVNFLRGTNLPDSSRIAVRINDIDSPFFREDIAQIALLPNVSSLVLPKIHSAQDIHHVSRELYTRLRGTTSRPPISIIPSIESARGLWNIGTIAGWQSEYGPELGGQLSALLFAAEDYCADTSIIRSPSRHELLFTRSQIAIVAKAFGLEAIDMVCVNYKDIDYLRDECQDGRRLGFAGKQAIHPTQVDVIQSTFVPSSAEILRAAKIIHKMEIAYASAKGAVGLEGEMIDAPMLKQAEKVLSIAQAAGIEIPAIS